MRIPVALCLAALLLAVPASAQVQFTMFSQNTLHYGWNQGAANRNLTFRQVFNQANVIVIQELMNVASLGELSPGNAFLFRASPLLGHGNYQEAYGFIIRAALNPQAVMTYADLNHDFSRPPAFIELRPGGAINSSWIGNIHIIFGDHVLERLNEAAEMMIAMNAVTGGNNTRVVIGGDWNLNANQLAFAGLGGAAPNVRTSLNQNGVLVSRYDHFVWRNVQVNNADSFDPGNLNPALTLLNWRQDISDHVGISCNVAY
jgi:hypothetical protein